MDQESTIFKYGLIMLYSNHVWIVKQQKQKFASVPGTVKTPSFVLRINYVYNLGSATEAFK